MMTILCMYGFILGFIQHLDYGGAISKVPNLICDGMLADGIYGPEAVKVLGSMVPRILSQTTVILS